MPLPFPSAGFVYPSIQNAIGAHKKPPFSLGNPDFASPTQPTEFLATTWGASGRCLSGTLGGAPITATNMTDGNDAAASASASG